MATYPMWSHKSGSRKDSVYTTVLHLIWDKDVVSDKPSTPEKRFQNMFENARVKSYD